MVELTQPKPKLLYVDDESDNLELFSLQFNKDFDITTCSGGDEALRILAEDQAIDILLTDERMPGMSGVELLEKVVKGYPHLIRIIVSAFSDSERLLNAINRGGAHEYIIKPWRRAEVEVHSTMARNRGTQKGTSCKSGIATGYAGDARLSIVKKAKSLAKTAGSPNSSLFP